MVALWFFKWIRTSITRNPYKFVIFQGGGGPAPRPPPPLDPHMSVYIYRKFQ